MRVTILAAGSRGDVEPFLALGNGLQRAGHQVRLTTHDEFSALVGAAGLEFAPLGMNPRQILSSPQGQAMLSARTPFGVGRRMAALLGPVLEQMVPRALTACRDADVVVYSTLAFAGHGAALHRGVPCLVAHLQPAVPTRYFATTSAPLPDTVPPVNRLSWLAMEGMFWRIVRPALAEQNRRVGLAPPPEELPYRALARDRIPVLHGFSEHIVPRPADWGPHVHVTGYWFTERANGYTPPQRLTDFLADGPTPLYVGFGSMPDKRAEQLAALVLEALRRADQRAVLLSGWSGLTAGDSDDHVLVVDEVPHQWLFPRVVAAVHHGGAGTTAAALRAGIPSVVVPFFSDQYFWGRRVAALGAGPAPIPRRRLTPARLAAAIREAVAQPRVRQAAAAIAGRLATEDGVARAVTLIEEHAAQARR